MGNLDKRFNKSYEDRNSGGNGKGVLDWSKAEGVTFYKLKEGINKLDVVPYIVKSSNHPLVKSGDLAVGDMDYVLDIWVHKNIGPVETDVACLKKSYGKVCPVCDKADDYKKQGKTDEFEAYKAKRRVFYNVIDITAEAEGIQVLEQSHFKFEKELVEAAREGEEIQPFYSPDKGVTVKFRGSAVVFKGSKMIEPKNFSFVARDTDLTKLVKRASSFDDLIIFHSSDELFALMNGADDDDDEAPTPRSKKPPVEEDDDEEEAPAPRKGKAKEAEEDDELFEDEPKAKSKKAPKEEDGPSCPSGHRFGKDYDAKPECEICPPGTWRACARAAK